MSARGQMPAHTPSWYPGSHSTATGNRDRQTSSTDEKGENTNLCWCGSGEGGVRKSQPPWILPACACGGAGCSTWHLHAQTPDTRGMTSIPAGVSSVSVSGRVVFPTAASQRSAVSVDADSVRLHPLPPSSRTVFTITPLEFRFLTYPSVSLSLSLSLK